MFESSSLIKKEIIFHTALTIFQRSAILTALLKTLNDTTIRTDQWASNSDNRNCLCKFDFALSVTCTIIIVVFISSSYYYNIEWLSLGLIKLNLI